MSHWFRTSVLEFPENWKFDLKYQIIQYLLLKKTHECSSLIPLPQKKMAVKIAGDESNENCTESALKQPLERDDGIDLKLKI